MPVVDIVRTVDTILPMPPPPQGVGSETRSRRVVNRFAKKEKTKFGQSACADECCRGDSEGHVEKPEGKRRVSFEETAQVSKIVRSKPIKSRTEPTKGEETTSYTKPAKTVIPNTLCDHPNGSAGKVTSEFDDMPEIVDSDDEETRRTCQRRLLQN